MNWFIGNQIRIQYMKQCITCQEIKKTTRSANLWVFSKLKWRHSKTSNVIFYSLQSNLHNSNLHSSIVDISPPWENVRRFCLSITRTLHKSNDYWIPMVFELWRLHHRMASFRIKTLRHLHWFDLGPDGNFRASKKDISYLSWRNACLDSNCAFDLPVSRRTKI